jgi:hypothetical protein
LIIIVEWFLYFQQKKKDENNEVPSKTFENVNKVRGGYHHFRYMFGKLALIIFIIVSVLLILQYIFIEFNLIKLGISIFIAAIGILAMYLSLIISKSRSESLSKGRYYSE